MRDKIIADVKKELSNFVDRKDFEESRSEIAMAIATISVFKFKMDL